MNHNPTNLFFLLFYFHNISFDHRNSILLELVLKTANPCNMSHKKTKIKKKLTKTTIWKLIFSTNVKLNVEMNFSSNRNEHNNVSDIQQTTK